MRLIMSHRIKIVLSFYVFDRLYLFLSVQSLIWSNLVLLQDGYVYVMKHLKSPLMGYVDLSTYPQYRNKQT